MRLRFRSSLYRFLGQTYIKERVQVEGRRRWRTVERRFFGPYPSALDALVAIESHGADVVVNV